MLSLVIMMRAHDESLTKSRRIKAAWEAKRKRASEEMLSAFGPSWLRLSPDRTCFVVIPERAEVIHRIDKLSVAGQGVVRIARKLSPLAPWPSARTAACSPPVQRGRKRTSCSTRFPPSGKWPSFPATPVGLSR